MWLLFAIFLLVRYWWLGIEIHGFRDRSKNLVINKEPDTIKTKRKSIDDIYREVGWNV